MRKRSVAADSAAAHADDLFRSRLENQIDLRHPLAHLAQRMPWMRWSFRSILRAMLGLAVAGLAPGCGAQAQAPRLAELISLEAFEALMDEYYEGGRKGRLGWQSTEILGCLPARERERNRLWRDHWVCVARTDDPDFYATPVLRLKNGEWRLVDIGGMPINPPMALVQAELRRLLGDASIKLTRDIDGGEGSLSDRRPWGLYGSRYPYRLMSLYEARISFYMLGLWYDALEGRYLFYPGEISGPGGYNYDPPLKTADEIEAEMLAPRSYTPSIVQPQGWSVSARRIPETEAVREYRLKDLLSTYSGTYTRYDRHSQVAIVEGDLHIEGNLDLDTVHSSGILVSGDLRVDGAILNSDYSGFLLVKGRTQARALVAGNAEIRLRGPVHVQGLILAHGNDGLLWMDQDLEAPLLINIDHHTHIGGTHRGQNIDGGGGDRRDWRPYLKLSPEEHQALDENFWRGIHDILMPALAKGRELVPEMENLKTERQP